MRKEDKFKLKIQLRAVSFAIHSHVLEYRIDPNQDITYEEEPTNFIKRLLKKLGWKFVKTFNTSWHQPQVFRDPLSMGEHDFYDDFNWGPIWCDTKEVLEHFKSKFKTYGDLITYLEEDTMKCHKKWQVERAKYLKNKETIY